RGRVRRIRAPNPPPDRDRPSTGRTAGTAPAAPPEHRAFRHAEPVARSAASLTTGPPERPMRKTIRTRKPEQQPRLGLESLETREVPAAGVLDPSFSLDGKLTTDNGFDDQAHAVLVQPDGKIV